MSWYIGILWCRTCRPFLCWNKARFLGLFYIRNWNCRALALSIHSVMGGAGHVSSSLSYKGPPGRQKKRGKEGMQSTPVFLELQVFWKSSQPQQQLIEKTSSPLRTKSSTSSVLTTQILWEVILFHAKWIWTWFWCGLCLSSTSHELGQLFQPFVVGAICKYPVSADLVKQYHLLSTN